ncbi:hypothetical protein L2E82_07862 [Cichorium intybus]|uniref:Uncharacterized protein n=1 Tax=Cichorium intybus TaxID=13427 RepID=A0ACB9G4I1_CICIN|nr:hypothetical protein L2E82_07862 [Cichorium intybus]
MLVKITIKGEGRRDRRQFLKSREEINGGSQSPGLLPVPGDDGLGILLRIQVEVLVVFRSGLVRLAVARICC